MVMRVGVYEITLMIPAARSLKEKRSVLKSLLTRIRQKFNVSVAETGAQDKWQAAELAVACVATDSEQVHRVLEKVLNFIEQDGSVLVIASSMQVI